MKSRFLTAAFAGFAAIAAHAGSQFPLGTEFTYQGRLNMNGEPFSGNADVIMTLWNDGTGGGQSGPSQMLDNVAIVDGVFTAELDFGATIFQNQARWIEIEVRTPPGSGAYTTLSPRQPLTATPYALHTRGVFVDETEKVGIGTINPISKLHIVGADNNGSDAALRVQSVGQGSRMLIDGNEIESNGTLFVQNNTSENLVLVNGGGDIGVGTTTPESNLHIVGDENDGTNASLQIDSGANTLLMDGNEIGSNVALAIQNNSAENVVIATGGGSVGVGTPNPVAQLHNAGDYYGLGNVTLHAAEGEGMAGDAIILASDRSTTNPFVGLKIQTESFGEIRDAIDINPVGVVTIPHVLNLGSTSVANPGNASTNLSISGRPGFDFAGSAAVTLADPTRDREWSLLLDTGGGISFNKFGDGVDTVGVPKLQIYGGSDIAEPFNVNSIDEVKPGMVVAIDPNRVGELRLATSEYDSTVAGVISGAGGVEVGMTLAQSGTVADGEHPIALTGRVWCYVDADANGAVKPGDLLTTSATPGHAMKATDRNRAGGAILGKAMSSLESGRGLVLVLVNLQ